MSCYIRHMKEFLKDTDFKLETREDRKKVDLYIREVIGRKPEDKCNEVWKDVKIWLNNEEKEKILKENLKKMEIN